MDAVKIDKLSHHEVAIKFGINKNLVNALFVAEKKDPKFIDKTKDREMKRRLKMRAVVRHSL